jgi:hypothetical protein
MSLAETTTSPAVMGAGGAKSGLQLHPTALEAHDVQQLAVRLVDVVREAAGRAEAAAAAERAARRTAAEATEALRLEKTRAAEGQVRAQAEICQAVSHAVGAHHPTSLASVPLPLYVLLRVLSCRSPAGRQRLPE